MAKSKRNRIIKILITLSLIAVIGIGATLAYLHDITETKKNVFTSNKRISIQLREPLWDGYGYSDEPGGDGTSAKPGITGDALEKLGLTQAQGYTPGQNIPKDPQVKNNGTGSTGVPAYVSLKVQYFDDVGQQVSYSTFKTNYLKSTGIVFDSKWTSLTSTTDDQIYLYNEILGTGQDTSANPLFNEVPISLDLVAKDNGTLPKFEIKITAYAIQSDNIEEKDVETEMLKFITK